MKTKHTQGKWSVIKSDATCTFLISSETEPDIARVPNIIKEAHANATLIANAPELLNSLIEMVNLFDRIHGKAMIGRPIRNKALRAIKKAIK
jgi:hypothetical protein